MKINTKSKQSLLKISFIFFCGLPALSTPSYKLPITPVTHTNSPVRSAPLVLSSHSVQTKHHLGKTPASESSFHNFSIDQLRYWNFRFFVSKQRMLLFKHYYEGESKSRYPIFLATAQRLKELLWNEEDLVVKTISRRNRPCKWRSKRGLEMNKWTERWGECWQTSTPPCSVICKASQFRLGSSECIKAGEVQYSVSGEKKVSTVGK